MATRVMVRTGEDSFTGTIEQSEATSEGERWIVAKDDGTKGYVYPSKAQVQVLEDSTPTPTPTQPSPEPRRDPMAPPPMPADVLATQAIKDIPQMTSGFQAPPPGVSTGGSGINVSAVPQPATRPQAAPVPLPASSTPQTPSQPPQPARSPQAPSTDQAALPVRFIVNPKSGKPKVFHTRRDCSRINGNEPSLVVDDEAIGFFDLEVCGTCDKRDRQVSFPEALAAITSLTEADAEIAFEKLTEMGFTVSPQAIDRNKALP